MPHDHLLQSETVHETSASGSESTGASPGLVGQLSTSYGPVGPTIFLDRDPGAASSAGGPAVDQALSQSGGGESGPGGARFHTGPVAESAAASLGARAFTAGSDVFFGAGQYNPGSADGDKLIRHEMSHVDQTRGQAAPTAGGGYRVSDPHEAAEVNARASADGGGKAGAAAGGTIYRDAGGAGAPTPWELFVASVGRHEADNAKVHWANPRMEKNHLASDAAVQLQVIDTFHHDAVKYLQEGGVTAWTTPLVNKVFDQADFAAWMAPLKTANMFTSFINAQPKANTVTNTQLRKLQTWMNAAADVNETKTIFGKSFQTPADPPYSNAWSWVVPANAWTKPMVQQLYDRIVQFNLPVGHVNTIKKWWNVSATSYTDGNGKVNAIGGAIYFGNPLNEVWFTTSQTNESAGLAANGTGTATIGGGTAGSGGGSTGHDGVGGTNTASATATTGAGTSAATNRLDHFTNAVIHEVAHGVGERIEGNTWAATQAYPKFRGEGKAKWGSDLWANDRAWSMRGIHEIIPSQDDAIAYMQDKIEGKAGTPTAGMTPAQFDAFLLLTAKDQELYKAWKQAGTATEPYQAPWKKGGRVYAYLSRWGSNQWASYEDAAWQDRVSPLASPNEFFAEQYTEYYRPCVGSADEAASTRLKGSTLRNATVKAYLDQVDRRALDPATGAASGTAATVPAATPGPEAAGGPPAAAAQPTGIPWP